jgi:hypothetical protein
MKTIFQVAVAVAFIAVLGFGVILPVVSRSNSLPDTMSSIMLKAMKRGYECKEAGRTIEACQQEQRERWIAVETGSKDLPEFGLKP